MPLDWDARYLAGDTPWDKGAPAPPLQDWLKKYQISGSVFVPGCGLGYDVRLIADEPEVSIVVGADISTTALRKAREITDLPKVRYIKTDILSPGLSLEVGTFNWVFEHTCLCALDPEDRQPYASNLAMLIPPGGHLLAVFFVEVEDYAGEGPPHPISMGEVRTLFAPYFDLLSEEIPEKHYCDRPFGAERICYFRRREDRAPRSSPWP